MKILQAFQAQSWQYPIRQFSLKFAQRKIWGWGGRRNVKKPTANSVYLNAVKKKTKKNKKKPDQKN